MPTRAILFDLFDTLIDLPLEHLPSIQINGRSYRSTYRRLHQAIVQRAPIGFEAFAQALARVDRELRDARYAEGREVPTRERFRELARSLGLEDPDLPDELTRIHMDALRATARLVPHHRQVLADLRGRVRLALVSNFSHAATARALLDQARLAELLDPIVISEEVGYRKPRPEIFRSALERLALDPHEALHVGDRLVADIDGAAALGIGGVWLTRRVADPGGSLARYSGARPLHVIGDLRELGAILDAEPT
ncbi:MAG: HAD family hydrolase [Myxococcota bacterium]